MRALSAPDSVSLAVERTREFLFNPFAWGTYLKLGLVAIITEGVGGNLSSSSHGSSSSGNGHTMESPFHLQPELIAAIVAAVLLAIVISIFVFYLITRLRFAYFHCLVYKTKEIGPGWRRYRAQALRFFWLNVVVGICFGAVLVLIAIPFAAGFWRVYRESQLNGQLDWGLLVSLVLPLIPIFILLALAGILTDVILRDWMLPHYALGNASAGEAWSEVWARISAEKRQFLVYALLRVILPTIAMIALFMVLIIPGLMVAGALGAIEYAIHSTFADAAGAGAVAGILLEVFFGVVAFVLALLAGICLGGPVSTWIREYALIFYGGRYQKLGDILYPPQAPPALGAPGIV
ncbi:MAG: hypothetical protein ABR956_17385 [Terracidiphilus sp.]|jgi:hypothetical protein